ncbi:MAG: hypothetical protein AAGG01_05930 [Planctomycetota bacterium]
MHSPTHSHRASSTEGKREAAAYRGGVQPRTWLGIAVSAFLIGAGTTAPLGSHAVPTAIEQSPSQNASKVASRTLEPVAKLHPLLKRAFEENEAMRGEGGHEWVAQGLADLADSGSLRKQAHLSQARWEECCLSIRTAAAAEFVGAKNVLSAVAQLRALEAFDDPDSIDLESRWALVSSELTRPKRRDKDGARRVQRFFGEFAHFMGRHQHAVDPVKAAMEAGKKAGCKARPDARSLRRQLHNEKRATDKSTAAGLVGLFWRGQQEDLAGLVRSKSPDHTQLFRYSTREDGQLYWELGGDQRPEELAGGEIVGRLSGMLSLPAGAYRVHVKCDDAIRLRMDGSTVVDTWTMTKNGAGLHWGRWFSRDVWLDDENPVEIDVWDGGNLFNLTVRIDQRQPDGSWKRVPFQLTHEP